MNVIREGLEKNLDISFYDNSEFDWIQMEQIMLGLEANLDVSVYAKTYFDEEQMVRFITRFRCFFLC